MTSREERRLIKRERELLETLAARRTPSQRQADMATGRAEHAEEDANGVSATERQARAALHSGAERTAGTTSERQSRAARGIDPGEESDYDRKRRLIREAFNRQPDQGD